MKLAPVSFTGIRYGVCLKSSDLIFANGIPMTAYFKLKKLQTSSFKLLVLALSVFAIGSLTSCGPKPTSTLSEVGQGETPGTPIIVVMGGYLSCKLPLNTPYSLSMYPEARKFITELSKRSNGLGARFVITCFHTSPSKMRYVTSDNPSLMYTTHPEDLNDIIMGQVDQTESHSLYLIGHSYGGWNVMKASATLPEQVRIKSLVTIDPISMENCKPDVFASAYVRSTFSFNPSVGCTQAPEDLRPHFTAINKRSSRWQHFYQNDYGFLHSSAVSETRSNRKLEIKTHWLNSLKAHLDIDSDIRTWQPVREAAFSDYPKLVSKL